MLNIASYRCWILAGSSLLSACANTARLEPPMPVAAAEWTVPPAALSPEPIADLAALLGSPELAALIERARIASPRILEATARIDQARARLRIARGAALPTLAVGGSLTANSNNLNRAFDFAANLGTIDASLSINLAGGVAAVRRSATERARAAVIDRQALEAGLTADLARSFVARAALKARLGLLEASIEQASKLQRIIELRQQEGVATKVDVGLQAIRVEQLRAEHDRLEQAFQETRVALALLAGEEAPGFQSTPAEITGFLVPALSLPVPSRLIGGRFDVRAAEARIAAAGGDVRAAKAAFYPTLDVSLSRSAQSFLTSGPLSGISIGANLLAPIFDRHRLSGNLNEAAAIERGTVQAYRTVLLTALADAENGLSAADHAAKRGVILASLASHARRTVELARQQYIEGDADLRHLLDAQDLLVSAQDAQMQNLQERLEAAIALYRISRG